MSCQKTQQNIALTSTRALCPIGEAVAPPVRRLHVDRQAANKAEETRGEVRCAGGAWVRGRRSDDHRFARHPHYPGDPGYAA